MKPRRVCRGILEIVELLVGKGIVEHANAASAWTWYDGMSFELKWYNPRNGKVVGKVVRLEGGDWGCVGYTPSGFHNADDWAAIVTRVHVVSND